MTKLVWFGIHFVRARVQSVLRQFVDTFCSHFQKNGFTAFQTWRTDLIWRALETSDPGASNRGSNVEIWPPGPNLARFKMAKLPRNWVFLAKLLTKNLYFLATQTFQTRWDRLQVVEFWRLTHRWMRQGREFPAHIELSLYDTRERLRRQISENQAKTLNPEHKVPNSGRSTDCIRTKNMASLDVKSPSSRK